MLSNILMCFRGCHKPRDRDKQQRFRSDSSHCTSINTMSLTFPQLCNGNPTEYKDELPHVLPQFFMPRLQDRPQDPIMDALRIKRESNDRETRLRQPPAEPVKSTVKVNLQEYNLDIQDERFWERTAM